MFFYKITHLKYFLQNNYFLRNGPFRKHIRARFLVGFFGMPILEYPYVFRALDLNFKVQNILWNLDLDFILDLVPTFQFWSPKHAFDSDYDLHHTISILILISDTSFRIFDSDSDLRHTTPTLWFPFQSPTCHYDMEDDHYDPIVLWLSSLLQLKISVYIYILRNELPTLWSYNRRCQCIRMNQT